MPLNFPSEYDEKAGLFGDIQDNIVLTLSAPCDNAEINLTFNETDLVDMLTVPGYLTFKEEDINNHFEIIKIVGKGDAGTGVLTVTRGSLSSTNMAHLLGEQATQDPVSEHIALLQALLEGVQKYQGLVGTDLPASCQPGECFINTVTGQAYYAVAEDTWEQLLYPDHGDYSGLDQDEHPNYHTEGRKFAWHADPLRSGGDHLTNPTTHNHSGSAGMGDPAARFRHGLASAKQSPTVANEVYLEEDTGDLYFASGSPLAWVKYSVIPIGSIVMFETDCPAGWSRFQLMDGRIPKGAPTGAWTLFEISNDINHTHVMADLVNHSHSIASKTFSTTSNGNHQHTIQIWGSSGGGILFVNYAYLSTQVISTSSIDNHTHSAPISIHNTSTVGDNTIDATAASNLPPYKKLVFCQKT